MNTANEIKAESSLDAQKTLNEQMDQVTQNPSARNVGRLAETVRAAGNQIKTSVGPSQDAVRTAANQTNTAIDPAEVTHTLRTKGISERQAGGIAEAIAARLNGQELTRPQRNLLSFALGNSVVRNTISDLLQKKANGVDSASSRVYDGNTSENGSANEAEIILWNLAKQTTEVNLQNLQMQATIQEQQQGIILEANDYSNVSEDSAPPQVQNTIPEKIYADDLSSKRILENGQSLKDMAKLYAEKVRANRIWGWRDDFPNAKRLSKSAKSAIKKYAIEHGLIPDVPVNTIKDTSGKIYRYVDFDAVGLVKEKVELPKYLWTQTDAVQFRWLDNEIGGRPKGYTWHHSEKSGQMELVPTGMHRIYHHNGGRTINHWAYREGGRNNANATGFDRYWRHLPGDQKN